MAYPVVINFHRKTYREQRKKRRNSKRESKRMRKLERKQQQLDQPTKSTSTPKRPSTPENRPSISAAPNTSPSALRRASDSPSSKKSVRFAPDTKTTAGNIGSSTVRRRSRINSPPFVDDSPHPIPANDNPRANTNIITPELPIAERNHAHNTSTDLSTAAPEPLPTHLPDTAAPPSNMQTAADVPTNVPTNAPAPTHDSYWTRFSRKLIHAITHRRGRAERAARKRAKKLQKQVDKERAQRAESLRRLSQGGWNVGACNALRPESGTYKCGLAAR